MTRIEVAHNSGARCRYLGLIFTVMVLFGLAGVSCGRPPADPTSPEGALRLYFEALKSGDTEAAFARFTDDLQLQCTAGSLASRTFEFKQALDDASVVVRRTTVDGDIASVEVSISSGRTDVGPLGPRPEGGFDQYYQLKRSGTEWRLSQFGWPIYFCEIPTKERPTEPAGTPIPPPVQ